MYQSDTFGPAGDILVTMWYQFLSDNNQSIINRLCIINQQSIDYGNHDNIMALIS